MNPEQIAAIFSTKKEIEPFQLPYEMNYTVNKDVDDIIHTRIFKHGYEDLPGWSQMVNKLRKDLLMSYQNDKPFNDFKKNNNNVYSQTNKQINK